jgi:hypothetical protein
VSCTSADRKAAAALSLGEHVIQAHDLDNFYNPPDRPLPHFAVAGLSLAVAALEGGPQ